MNVAIYVRQSLAKDGDELGIDRQRFECERLTASRGYTVTEVIADNNRSASTGDRPGYRRVLQLIEAKAIDAVVVLRVDRLLRKLTELEKLIELSERTGVQIVTVEGDLDLASPSGRLIGRILASVARSEMETKSARHKLANAQKAKAGKPHGSRRPYGYNEDQLTLHPEESEILREMGRRVLAGYSYRDVAAWANDQGHRTTMGRTWFPITISNMLQRKRYGGIREYQGAEYPGIWEPIFDASIWERLQLTIRLRRETAGNMHKARRYLLTGLLVCGVCGTHLNGETKRDKPERPLRRTYQCRACHGITRNAEALEWFVTECVLTRLDTPDLGKLLSQSGPHDDEMRDLLIRRKGLSDRLNALVDDYATGLLDREQLTRAKSTAEAELARIDTDIEVRNRQRSGAGLVPVGQSIRKAWDEADSDDWRRTLLGLLIKPVVVNPGNTKPYVRVNGRLMRFDQRLIEIDWLV
jgi:site-specific DNA recombinase